MSKTIITILLSDRPKGIKKVSVGNKICNCIYLTRNDLKTAKGIEDLNKTSLYLLFGKNKTVYIGETTNFNKRIIDHKQKKTFWDEILVFTASNNSLTKSEVQYLEYLALQKTKKYTNYSLEGNKQKPNIPHLEEYKIGIVEEFFEEIVFLASFLNFNIFEDYEKINEKEILLCGRKDIESKGFYDGTKLIVLKNSKIVKDVVSSYGDDKKEKRNKTLSEKAIEKDDYFLLQENIEFSSPSKASSFCLGSSSNGWTEWKNKSKITMDEIFRQNVK